MALYYVGGNGTATNQLGGTVNLPLTSLTGGVSSAAREGDIVIVAVVYGYVDPSLNADVQMSTSGYTEIYDLYANDTRPTNFGLFWKIMGSTPDTQAVAVANPTGSSNFGTVLAAYVWRGAHADTPFGTPNSATGIDVANANPPSVTPTVAGSQVIAVGAAAGLGTSSGHTLSFSSLSSGFTNVYKTSRIGTGGAEAVGFCSLAWTSGAVDPGAFTPDDTTNSSSWAAATLVLQPAAEPAFIPKASFFY